MKLKLGVSNGIKIGALGVSKGSGVPADTTAPTVTITCAQGSSGFATTTSPLNFTFTFSETVTGFVAGDITVSGGTASNFAGSGAVYTCDISFSASATLTVDVGAGVCVDGGGNGNTAATQFVVYVIIYDLLDTFTTAAGAPLTSPRNAEPGPGQWTIVDTGNRLTISSGALQGNGTGGGNDPNLKFVTSRAAGRVTKASFPQRANNILYGPNPLYLQGSNNPDFTAACNAGNANIPFLSLSAGTVYDWAIVMQATGSYHLVKVSGAWYLAWIDNTGSGAATDVYLVPDGVTTNAWDYGEVAKVTGGFETAYGLATNRSASPSSGDSLTHVANGWAECTWTAATNATFELWLRKSDASNGWIIRCSQAGSTVKLIEYNAGVETERASAAQTFTNGNSYLIKGIALSNRITTYVGATKKNDYTSASFNNTATIAYLNVTAGALSNFITWPAVLSGIPATIMDAF